MNFDTFYCGMCTSPKLPQDFLPVGDKCIYNKNGHSVICTECLIKNTRLTDLDQADKLCQFLDIPFLTNDWIDCFRQTEDPIEALCNYIQIVRKDEYRSKGWKEYNLLWDKAKETNLVLSKLPSLSKDLMVYLKKKWGQYEDFIVEDYIKMESYEKNTLNYYNFRDEARRDMIRKLALVSVLIDKKLAAGDTKEVATLISSYQSLMKESGIQNAVRNDTETIETLSELIAFLEEHNWLMDYKVTESRDIVDATIRNFQQYVAALVTGGGEEVAQMYNSKLAEEQSGTPMNEMDIESMFEAQEAENEQFDDEALNEEELVSMFKEISKANE